MQTHGNRVPSGAEVEIVNHPEMGVALPFDPMYCDENDNQNVDKEEIRPDNICKIPGGQEAFARKPIAAFGLRKGQLILTIDDGPNDQVTRPILDMLDDYKIKATFFIVGSRIASNKNLVREMIARGHTIGNHTFSHDVPNINANTITGEVIQSYNALTEALGQRPKGRVLFRAPGLGWSEPKAIALNNNAITEKFIGPIHANLGTDAPRADWSCWSKGLTAETCAEYYFQDIMNAGRGIILSHDIYFRQGRGNTYEMLKILLSRLESEGGGIANKHDGEGVWSFVSLPEQHVLDQFDTAAGSKAQ